MRRKEKAIEDGEAMAQIINKCQVVRLGLAQDNIPYIVPLSFGFDGRTLYFHTALKGRKTDILAVNPQVCFEFETGVKVMPHPTKACSWSFSFQSIIGFGRAQELESVADKRAGLTHIMAHYSDQDWQLTDQSLASLRVWAIHVESMTGKQSLDCAGD